MVVGSITLALAEGQINGSTIEIPDTNTPQPTTTPLPEIEQPPVAPIENTSPPSSNEESNSSPTEQPPTLTFTPIPTSESCPAPSGWSPIIINPGDTLNSLSVKYGTTINQLMQANCLLVAILQPGSIFFVPNLKPTITTTSVPMAACGHPNNWILYTIQPKDTLYSLGKAFGTTYQELQFANCLGNSTYIRAGDKLWVPNVSTITPTLTKPQKPTKINTPSPSNTATETPTETPTPSPT